MCEWINNQSKELDVIDLLDEALKSLNFGGYKVQSSELCDRFIEERKIHEIFTEVVGEPISHGDRRTLYLAKESDDFENFLKKEKSIEHNNLKISNYNSPIPPQIIPLDNEQYGVHHTCRPPNPFRFSSTNVWREIDNVAVPNAMRSVNFDIEKFKKHEIVYVNEVRKVAKIENNPFRKIEIYKFKCEELKENRADWYGDLALKPFFVDPDKYYMLMNYIAVLSGYTGRFLEECDQSKKRQMIDVLKCASLRFLKENDWEKINFSQLCVPPTREQFSLLFGTESVEEWFNAWYKCVLPNHLFKKAVTYV